MSGQSRISEPSFPLPPWTRTPFVVAGLAALAVAWRYLDGLLAVQSASTGVSLGAILVLLFVAVSTLVGVALVSTGLVVPGASRVPGVPELGFPRRLRRLVVRGAALSLAGPFAGITADMVVGPLPGETLLSPLATLPVALGWTLVLFGLLAHFAGKLHLSRLASESVRESLASVPGALGRPRLAVARTLLVAGGAPVVLVGMTTVFVELQVPIDLGSPEFAVACAAFHLGAVLPGAGPQVTLPPLVRSATEDDLTLLGGLVAAAGPLLFHLLTSALPFSSLLFARSDFVLLGWALASIGAKERFA